MTQAEVEHEMAWTTWQESCRDPAVIDGSLRQCRRRARHNDDHASGYGRHYRKWGR